MQKTTNLQLNKPDLTDYVNVGDLNENADLIDAAVTTNKDNLATHTADYTQQMGTAELVTTDKTIKGAVNELFTNVSNGKQLVGTAITDKGVTVPTNPTFNQLSDSIRLIIPAKKWLEGQTPGVNVTVTAYHDFTVSGIGFNPSYFIVRAYTYWPDRPQSTGTFIEGVSAPGGGYQKIIEIKNPSNGTFVITVQNQESARTIYLKWTAIE